MAYGMTDDLQHWRERALAAEEELARVKSIARRTFRAYIEGPDTTRFRRDGDESCITVSRLLSQLGVKYENDDEIEITARVVSRVVTRREPVR